MITVDDIRACVEKGWNKEHTSCYATISTKIVPHGLRISIEGPHSMRDTWHWYVCYLYPLGHLNDDHAQGSSKRSDVAITAAATVAALLVATPNRS